MKYEQTKNMVDKFNSEFITNCTRNGSSLKDSIAQTNEELCKLLAIALSDPLGKEGVQEYLVEMKYKLGLLINPISLKTVT